MPIQNRGELKLWGDKFKPGDVGLIYVVADPIGHFKVGCTNKRRMDIRLADLQTGNPLLLKYIYVAWVDVNAVLEAEQMAHSILAKYRVRGEWFRGPVDQILNAAEYAAEKVSRKLSVGITSTDHVHLSKVNKALLAGPPPDEVQPSAFDMALPEIPASTRKSARRLQLTHNSYVLDLSKSKPRRGEASLKRDPDIGRKPPSGRF